MDKRMVNQKKIVGCVRCISRSSSYTKPLLINKTCLPTVLQPEKLRYDDDRSSHSPHPRNRDYGRLSFASLCRDHDPLHLSSGKAIQSPQHMNSRLLRRIGSTLSDFHVVFRL